MTPYIILLTINLNGNLNDLEALVSKETPMPPSDYNIDIGNWPEYPDDFEPTLHPFTWPRYDIDLIKNP